MKVKKTIAKQTKKGLIPTMVFKAEKSKTYDYKLKDGSILSFSSKEFPIDNNQNSNGQLILII